MKNFYLALTILLFVSTLKVFSQISTQQPARQNCSFVSRPIIDIGSKVVIGKLTKIKLPRLDSSVRKFFQNTVVTVKIEVDENGKVTYAKAENCIANLQNILEESARNTIFNPTLVDGAPVKIEGQAIYKFTQRKIEFDAELDSSELKPAPIDYERLKFLRIFESEIITVIYNFRENKNSFYPFINNGKAEIQICLQSKTPEIVEKIKQIGFEVLEETQGNGLAGQIAVMNLEKLAAIEEIRFIVPD